MKTYLIAFISSFLYLLAVTPFLIYIGKKYGFVDKANRRSVHKGLIPRIGGIGIATGTVLPLIMLSFYDNDPSAMFFSTAFNPIVVIGGGLAISIFGLVDDIKGIPARYKFLFQIMLATMAYYLGFAMESVQSPFGMIYFGWLSLPITILWIVGIINAFNLIDGLDGLSSGIAFFVTITLFILALHNNVLFVALLSACLAGAVVGFLVYNFNPAKIFMGDAGSMFIGFILAVLSLKGASKGSAIVSLLIPIMAMGVPILDTTLAFVRRFLRNQPIFLADRQHIHHILLSKGFNQRKVVMILYGISMSFTLLALFSIFLKDKEVFLILLVFSIIIVVIITKLGYMDIIYGKYKSKKADSIESLLETVIVNKISTIPLAEMESLIFSLPINGFTVLKADGQILFESGKPEPTNFLDIVASKDHFLRFHWNGTVPAINAKEAQMFTIIAKSLLKYVSTNKKL